jgi:hypothetical protein
LGVRNITVIYNLEMNDTSYVPYVFGYEGHVVRSGYMYILFRSSIHVTDSEKFRQLWDERSNVMFPYRRHRVLASLSSGASGKNVYCGVHA